MQLLRTGVSIRIEGGINYTTPVCKVDIIERPEIIYPFINLTKGYGAHTWLLITLYEGKYRQVRKMFGAVRHRCKRLIRVCIEDILIEDLAPGNVKEVEEDIFFEKLKIEKEN